MLEDNGICGVVLPDGSELTNKSYYNIRKYLINNCKILKVINVSGGAFNSTGVKTKILIFKKIKENDNHKNIEFLEINKECNEIKLIAIADLENNYSFNLNVNQEIVKYNDNIEIKTLGEVCEIIKGNKIKSSLGSSNGLYPLYYCSILGNIYFDKYTFDGYGIIINKTNGSGKCMIYLAIGKYNVGETTIHFKAKSLELTKYIYYYLLNNLNIIELLFEGVNQKSITDDNLNLIKIPIPPIEVQQDLINKFDIFENTNKDIIKLIENLKELNKIKIESLFNKEIEFIEFGDMFNLIEGSIQSSKVIEDFEGITLVTGAKEFKKIKKFSDFTIISGQNLFISTKGNGDKIPIKFYDDECYYSCLMSLCKIKEDYIDKINIKYIYYYLLNKQEYIENNYQLGCANKKLDIEQFNLMKIPIPSLEVQKDIIDYCDNNNEIIKNINNTIELNKKLMKDIINIKL
jgi:restriction endonuclease S subunit